MKKNKMALIIALSIAAKSSYANYSCDVYDSLQTRSEAALRQNPTCDTISPEMGGVRSSLANNGIGIFGSINPVYKYDLLGHNENPQLYNGQDPTTRASGSIGFTYDMTRIGIGGNAQLTMQIQGETGNYTAGNPNFVHMSIFSINQQFYDKQLEIQYGYYPLVRQFYGNVLGGNSSTAALGPTSIIPVEVGLSYITPSPSFMVTLKDPSLDYYNRIAVARSGSPHGLQYDIDNNESGFTINVDGSDPLIIDELGYKTGSSKDKLSTDARVGWIYNTTDYQKFGTDEYKANNYGGYIALTQQITQPDGQTHRGLYFDTKFNYAPEDRNLYAKDYQLNLFYIGPFDIRSSDMASLSFSRSYFSKDARTYYKKEGDNVADFSTAYSFSYAAQVFRGLFLISGLTYQQDPNFNPKKSDAVLLQESLYFSF